MGYLIEVLLQLKEVALHLTKLLGLVFHEIEVNGGDRNDPHVEEADLIEI